MLFFNLALYGISCKLCFNGINWTQRRSLSHGSSMIICSKQQSWIWLFIWPLIFLDQSGGQWSWLAVCGWSLPLSSVWAAWRILCASLRLPSYASGKGKILELERVLFIALVFSMNIFTPCSLSWDEIGKLNRNLEFCKF